MVLEFSEGSSQSGAGQQPLTLAERRPLREDVRDAIMNAILDGMFQPGDRIVESRVARQLGVSQATVREALREIEAFGIIATSTNRGAFVRPLTTRDVVEMYDMRALLEGHAARLAVQRLSDEDLARLEALVDEQVQLASSGQVREMIARDVDFHEFICAAADHSLLMQLWSRIHPHLWTFVAVQGLIDMPPMEVASRHRAVVDALRSKDPDQAEQAMSDHLLELRERAQQVLARRGEEAYARHSPVDAPDHRLESSRKTESV